MSFPVALQLYSVRDAMAEDFVGTIKKVKEMGYDGVEFAGLNGLTADEIKSTCAELGLTPISAHVPYSDMVNDPRGVLSTYAEIGCRYVAIPYLTPECRPGTDGFVKVVENAAMLGKVARDLGMTLLYHNHDFEFEKIDGKYALEILYDTVPADLLQTELDTCWVNVGGEEPAPYILKYKGRTPVIHLKDFVMKGKDKPKKLYELIGIEDDEETASEEDFSFRPVGSGVQDIPAIIKAGEESGAQWFIVEQDLSVGRPPLEACKMSIEYLKSIGL